MLASAAFRGVRCARAEAASEHPYQAGWQRQLGTSVNLSPAKRCAADRWNREEASSGRPTRGPGTTVLEKELIAEFKCAQIGSACFCYSFCRSLGSPPGPQNWRGPKRDAGPAAIIRAELDVRAKGPAGRAYAAAAAAGRAFHRRRRADEPAAGAHRRADSAGSKARSAARRRSAPTKKERAPPRSLTESWESLRLFGRKNLGRRLEEEPSDHVHFVNCDNTQEEASSLFSVKEVVEHSDGTWRHSRPVCS